MSTALIIPDAHREALELTPDPSISHQHDVGRFTLHDVPDLGRVSIHSPGLEYKVFKNNKVDGEYRVTYDAKEGNHRVFVGFDGKPLPGTPFMIAPGAPTIKHDPMNKEFTLERIHDLNKLSLLSNTLPFSVYKNNAKKSTYLVKHMPGNQAHDVLVKYGGRTIKGGNFRLAPHPQRQQRLAYQQPPMIAAAPYYNQSAQPAQYAQPNQPAQCNQIAQYAQPAPYSQPAQFAQYAQPAQYAQYAQPAQYAQYDQRPCPNRPCPSSVHAQVGQAQMVPTMAHASPQYMQQQQPMRYNNGYPVSYGVAH